MLDLYSLKHRAFMLAFAGVLICAPIGVSAQESSFRPLNIDDIDAPSILDSTSETADIARKMAEIDETLRLLSRRLEAMPLPGSRALQADENQQELLARLSAMELQLQTLNQAHLDEAAKTKNNLDEAGVADLRVRLTGIEEIMRNLNGQLEDVSFRLTKLSERFEQVAADTEFRFQEMELAARQNRGGAGADSQVLGRLKTKRPAIVSRNGDGDNIALVGEAPPANVTIVPGRNVAVAKEDLPDPRKLYDEALANLRNGKIEEAQDRLIFFLTNYKKHKLRGNAQYWLGETYYVRRDYKAAAEAFLAGYTDYAQSAKAPDSLLKLGMTLIVLGEKKTGCDAFAELASRFPKAPRSVIQRAEIERQRAACR